jgi:CBS domain containing-hemolysin-like protein
VVYSKDLARLMFFRPKSQQRAAAKDPVNAEDAAPTRLANPQLGLPFMELRLRQVMREVLVVPETKSALALLREFQKRRRQMAIVVDEYGSTVGLVTAEDAIEQLTGEFEDEFDDHALPVLTTASGALIMDGGVNLRDLETQMQWSLPREGGVETLAGFVLIRLGHIPKEGESIEFEGRRLTVVEMDARRIARIRVEPVEEEESTSDRDTPAK